MPLPALGAAIRVSVVGPASLSSEQIRSYAEYRMFSSLVVLAPDVQQVDMVVTAARDGSDAVCRITVDLGAAGRVRARVRRPGAVRAIDAAAEAVTRAATRRASRTPKLEAVR